MKTQDFRVAGESVQVHYVENEADVEQFIAWHSANVNRVIAIDTETTGLDIWSKGFKCRLVQLGTANTAYVLDAERWKYDIGGVLQYGTYVAHNAPYDQLVLDRAGIADFESLSERTYDTFLLAHLLDPRTESDGGPGLGLKALSTVYVDPEAADTSNGLQEVFRKEYKANKQTGWALIDIDHPLYTLYAGLDVIYTARLLRELSTLIHGLGLSDLARFEHDVQRITTRMQRRGLLIDVPYTESLRTSMLAEAEKYRAVAAGWGVANVNSTKQVTEALLAMGEDWSQKTASGAPAVGKDVLSPLADIDARSWERLNARDPNPLADAIIRAKRADKWRESYVESFLSGRDENDRIHPFIKSLAARTARMAVSNPPLQQLPSSDWTIRRAVVADPGHTIIAADYKSMELRVLAALANVEEMKRAIREGRDLHDFTASLLYGPDFTKAQRRLAKGVGLGKVFGGGAAGLAQQIGAPLEQVKYAVRRYDSVYPEVAKYSSYLKNKSGNGLRPVETPIGRLLPLDNNRTYACVNYVVQSTARDLIAQALVDIDAAGMGDCVLMPVHDELICQAPDGSAEEVIRTIGGLMESTFQGVRIESDPSVYGKSWGAGYGAPASA